MLILVDVSISPPIKMKTIIQLSTSDFFLPTFPPPANDWKRQPEYMMIHVLFIKEFLTLQNKYLNWCFYFSESA